MAAAPHSRTPVDGAIPTIGSHHPLRLHPDLASGRKPPVVCSANPHTATPTSQPQGLRGLDRKTYLSRCIPTLCPPGPATHTGHCLQFGFEAPPDGQSTHYISPRSLDFSVSSSRQTLLRNDRPVLFKHNWRSERCSRCTNPASLAHGSWINRKPLQELPCWQDSGADLSGSHQERHLRK